MRLDVQLTDLNQSQDISAPSNAKPFDQLLNMLGSVTGTGGATGSSSSSGGSSSDASSGTSRPSPP